MNSPRNKTITLAEVEKTAFRREICFPEHKLSREALIDRIICGDSLKLSELLPEKFADLMIVDPPYNLTKSYGQSLFKKQGSKEYEAFTRSWIEKTLPHLKENATVYVCSDWQSSIIIAPILEEYFTVRNRISWQREKGRGADSNWKNCTEDIWYCTTGREPVFNLDAVKIKKRVIAPYRENGKPKDWSEEKNGKFRATCPSNFWNDITIPFWSMPENTEHPTQKPEKLIAKLVLASSNENDIVFDPFLGSGTTAVVAKKLSRHFCGIEAEEDYCCLALKRLAIAEEKPDIQGYENGIFLERNSYYKD